MRKKEVDTMMKISEMIAMLAEVMADHGDKEVVFVNDETGEIRYAIGMTVDSQLVAIDHISYGEKVEIETATAIFDFLEQIGGVR
jgi:hypothetical protein